MNAQDRTPESLIRLLLTGRPDFFAHHTPFSAMDELPSAVLDTLGRLHVSADSSAWVGNVGLTVIEGRNESAT